MNPAGVVSDRVGFVCFGLAGRAGYTGDTASMGDLAPASTTIDRSEESSQAIFQQEWQVYRTLVDQNYLFHREAYACLHQLVEEVPDPFHFLDIACGDATASVAALAGTRIAHYDGIDLSAAALELARDALSVLQLPGHPPASGLRRGAPRAWSTPVDVAWIGLSLHHLHTSEKLEVMRDIHRILRPGGRFLLYEDASPGGETREVWLRRWDAQGVLAGVHP